MKRLLLVTDAWEPQTNGVVRVLKAFIPLLEKKGYEITLIEPSQFKTIALPSYPEIRIALFSRRRISTLLKKTRFDAICLVTEGPLGWTTRSLCRKRKIPFITWYHSNFKLYVDLRLRGLLAPVDFIVRKFHSHAVRTMVSTESLRTELEASGFKKLVIMPLGVDTKLFVRNPLPSIKALPSPVFVFFSRLAPEKSPEDFLKLDLPGTKLVIGDGPLRKKLEKQYGDTHIFVGYKNGQELVDWLSLADVFIFSSRTETFGLVALEALACGVPVAAYNVMGPRDIITNGVDGYLGDDLRDSAIKCLKLSRADCRKKAEQFSWEKSSDIFIRNVFSLD